MHVAREERAADSHLIVVNADKEEEGGVAPVDDLVVPVLHERTLHQHKTSANLRNRKRKKAPISIQIQEAARAWARDPWPD